MGNWFMIYFIAFCNSIVGRFIGSLLNIFEIQLHRCWFNIVPILFGMNLIFWDSINIYFDHTPKRPRKLRCSKNITWSTFPRSWMVLTGALMSIAFGSYYHPYYMPIECIQSTFLRASKISEFVNLSPITLLHYNFQQINKLSHNLFQSDNTINHISTTNSKTSIPSNSYPALDILPFLLDLNDHIHHIDCTNSLKGSFEYAINNCPNPKICNALVGENVDSSLFHPLSSSTIKKFPIIFDSGASVAISGYKDDFISELKEPSSEIRLGGMANGMLVKGIGNVKWSLQTGSDTVIIHTQCYYVPSAKVRLISPQ